MVAFADWRDWCSRFSAAYLRVAYVTTYKVGSISMQWTLFIVISPDQGSSTKNTSCSSEASLAKSTDLPSTFAFSPCYSKYSGCKFSLLPVAFSHCRTPSSSAVAVSPVAFSSGRKPLEVLPSPGAVFSLSSLIRLFITFILVPISEYSHG